MLDTQEGFQQIKIPQHILDEWQKLVNFIARFLEVDFVFISQIDDNQKDIRLVRITEKNPLHYTNGQIFKLNGTFCEKTVGDKRTVIVTNLDTASQWNPIPKKYIHIKAYLGLPVFLNNGNVFGTFCIEHRKERQFTEREIEFMESFRTMIQAHLELIEKNEALERLNKRVDGFEKLMKICCNCKKIFGEDGKWHNIEDYILEKTGSVFTHAYCDICGKKILDELDKMDELDHSKN